MYRALHVVRKVCCAKSFNTHDKPCIHLSYHAALLLAIYIALHVVRKVFDNYVASLYVANSSHPCSADKSYICTNIIMWT